MAVLDLPRASIDLELAGLPFRVDFAAAELPWVEPRFGLYRAPPREGVTLRIDYDPSVTIAQPASIRYPGVEGRQLDDGTLLFRRDGLELRHDPVRRLGRALVARTPGIEGSFTRNATSLDTPLRVLLATELARANGLLVHATGFADDRTALLFPAVSGGGKTTTARKMPAPNVLSDDQVALILGPRGWEAHALPFVGILGRPTVPRRAPLSAIAFLGKSPEPRARRLRPAEALSRLLGCVAQFTPDAAQGPAIDLAERLVRSVPACVVEVAEQTPFDEMRSRIEQATTGPRETL